jgi:natural product precursor
MKKENKLTLKKVTVSNLLREQMKEVQGGDTFSGLWTVPTPAMGSLGIVCKETAEQSCVSGSFRPCR